MLRLQIAVVVLLRPWCHRNYSAVSAWPFRTCRHGRWSITLHLQFVSTDWNGGVRSVVQLRPGIALTTSDLLLASCQKGRSLFPHLEHSRGTVADQMGAAAQSCGSTCDGPSSGVNPNRSFGPNPPFRHQPPVRRDAIPRVSPEAGCPGYRRACSRAASGTARSAAAQRPPSAVEPFSAPPSVPRH